MGAQVVVVGAGVMGAATACFLARDHAATVTLVERDPTHRRASSALSASSIRQQFSQPANIALSRWSLGFMRRIGDELATGDQRPSIGLVERGYLYLAADAAAAARLQRLNAVQREAGADVRLLDAQALSGRFPWLRSNDVVLASLGESGEGWFDGPALMSAFLRKARACGARIVPSSATGFDVAGDRVTAVRLEGGARIDADAVVLAAGAWTAPLAAALGVAVPVAARKRDVFVFDSPAALAGCPLVIDPSGVWFRPEGRGFITGAPPRGEDPDEPPLDDIDHGLFDEVIWPALARRVPAFEALRVRSAWAGYYEMNLFDHNGLAGALPGMANAWTACGFSGHGMQQAPAVGCALAAMVAGAPLPSGVPSLEPFAPGRVAAGRPLHEANVI
jgi:glycine/D-amino acid oxidase-like deaminating enzyme